MFLPGVMPSCLVAVLLLPFGRLLLIPWSARWLPLPLWPGWHLLMARLTFWLSKASTLELAYGRVEGQPAQPGSAGRGGVSKTSEGSPNETVKIIPGPASRAHKSKIQSLQSTGQISLAQNLHLDSHSSSSMSCAI